RLHFSCTHKYTNNSRKLKFGATASFKGSTWTKKNPKTSCHLLLPDSVVEVSELLSKLRVIYVNFAQIFFYIIFLLCLFLPDTPYNHYNFLLKKKPKMKELSSLILIVFACTFDLNLFAIKD
ncbi:hypothetical protein C1646_690810, partial [Rhizophagus diaphanus]